MPIGPRGPRGAAGVPYGCLENVIEMASGIYGSRKENILIGYKRTPPPVAGYELYIYYNGGGAEFFRWDGKEWINLSYKEE